MFSPGGLLIPPSCPINLFWGGSRTPSVVAGLRGPRPRRPPPLASICLFCSGGPRPVSYLCVSRGASRVPSPTRAFWEGGVMSVLCRVCSVFPSLVSIFGLFPVLVKCDYQFILVQRCLSHYLCLSCVFIVLSGRLVILVCVSLALSCPALFVYIKDSLF